MLAKAGPDRYSPPSDEERADALAAAVEDGPLIDRDRGIVVMKADPELAAFIHTLIERQRPHICTSCAGTGWVEDENWSAYEHGPPAKDRVEEDGLIPCGRCNFGNWSAWRDEITEPTTVVDSWTEDQEAHVVEVLGRAARMIGGEES